MRTARHRHAPQWFLQHGSGPTPHGLAGLSVCVCGCNCVCVWGCMVDASPNANACRLKNGSLFSPLSLLFGKVYVGLLVLAVIFFLSRRTESQRDAPVIHFGIQHLLIWSRGMEFLCFFFMICALKCAFLICKVCLIYKHANLLSTVQQYTGKYTHTHQSLQHPSMPSVSAPL